MIWNDRNIKYNYAQPIKKADIKLDQASVISIKFGKEIISFRLKSKILLQPNHVYVGQQWSAHT